MLIIEIDGYFHQALVIGKKCSKQQLNYKYLLAKELTDEIRDFPKLFCRLHNFELIPYDSEIEVDFVIDTDTDRIHRSSY
ncbi:hypothetical protein ACIQ7N_06280 [Lysinibacillus sp. NPDC095746]|uniref:hypothetical protein n=1 Tax=Lysinibacillus sp. NPDC095746 TaxID=3364134 RepID=UPI0037F16EB8